VIDAEGAKVLEDRRTWPVRAPLFKDGEAQFY
jgi:hypothetical protein